MCGTGQIMAWKDLPRKESRDTREPNQLSNLTVNQNKHLNQTRSMTLDLQSILSQRVSDRSRPNAQVDRQVREVIDGHSVGYMQSTASLFGADVAALAAAIGAGSTTLYSCRDPSLLYLSSSKLNYHRNSITFTFYGPLHNQCCAKY